MRHYMIVSQNLGSEIRKMHMNACIDFGNAQKWNIQYFVYHNDNQ